MPNQPSRSDDPLKGKKIGGWTKWGGARMGLGQEQVQETWYCQTCGLELPKELPPFLFEVFPQEFIRVCNICENLINKVKVRNNPTITFRRVIMIRRKQD